MVFELNEKEVKELLNLVEEFGNPSSDLDIKLRQQFNFQSKTPPLGLDDGDQFTGAFDYIIRRAAAGNWCVDVQGYEEEVTYPHFNTSREAWCFIQGMEAVGDEPLTHIGNIYDDEEA